MTEKFIMVDLENDSSKEIANVISNDTSRKILDYLSDHVASETDICKALDLAPSTVHYNIKQLLKTNLIKVKEFFWSDKGNKVNVYAVSNKLIVIAPKKSEFKNRLKDLFGVLALGGVVSGVIYALNRNFTGVLDSVSFESSRSGELMAADMAPMAEKAVDVMMPSSSDINVALWFFGGTLFAVLIWFIITYFRRKK